MAGSLVDAFGALGSNIGGLFDSPGSKAAQDMIKKGKGFGYLKDNPYQSGWNSLIGMLQQRAQGQNSLAERQVRDVAAQGMHQMSAMGSGRSAGAARNASLGMSQISQGLENSAAEARLAEEQSAQGQLASALGGAGNAQFARDAANQNAYLQTVLNQASQPSRAQQIAGMAAQVGTAAAGAGAGGAGAAGAAKMAQGGGMQGLGGGLTSGSSQGVAAGAVPNPYAPGNGLGSGMDNPAARVYDPYAGIQKALAAQNNPFAAKY